MTTAVMETKTENSSILDLGAVVTIREMTRLFRCTQMTILNWRRKHGLPYIMIPGASKYIVRFDRNKVLAWAKTHGKRVYLVNGHEHAS